MFRIPRALEDSIRTNGSLGYIGSYWFTVSPARGIDIRVELEVQKFIATPTLVSSHTLNSGRSCSTTGYYAASGCRRILSKLIIY